MTWGSLDQRSLTVQVGVAGGGEPIAIWKTARRARCTPDPVTAQGQGQALHGSVTVGFGIDGPRELTVRHRLLFVTADRHLTAPSCQLHPPCEDLLYIQLKGALRAPGRGWPPFMRERRATAALTVERRSVRPSLAGHQGQRRSGAGCLTLSPSGHVGAGAHSALAADRTGGAPRR